MDIEKKFQKGAITRTYQRVDSQYKTDIFLGYNDDGNMSMVITEFGKEGLPKSSKAIDINLRRREDKKLSLSFDLIDITFKNLFFVFCQDIILVCENDKKENAIKNAMTRWKYWRGMFSGNPKKTLDKTVIKGLIGELIILKEDFIKKYGVDNAIESWMGPLFGHKDFEIEDTWYEVKTVNENSTALSISSLEQLESKYDGHLIVVRLEETSTVSSVSINLNQAVLNITSEIKEIETMDLFRNRLENLGYVADKEYDNINFQYKGKQYYFVDDSFPKITREDVHPSICNAQYTVSISGISEFKEEGLK